MESPARSRTRSNEGLQITSHALLQNPTDAELVSNDAQLPSKRPKHFMKLKMKAQRRGAEMTNQRTNLQGALSIAAAVGLLLAGGS
jgi:hypothetical protein